MEGWREDRQGRRTDCCIWGGKVNMFGRISTDGLQAEAPLEMFHTGGATDNLGVATRKGDGRGTLLGRVAPLMMSQ